MVRTVEVWCCITMHHEKADLPLHFLCTHILRSKYVSTEGWEKDTWVHAWKAIYKWKNTIVNRFHSGQERQKREEQGAVKEETQSQFSLFNWTVQTSHRQSVNPHYYHFVCCHFGSWPKVHQFNVSCSVNENILWFDIPVSQKKTIRTFPDHPLLSHPGNRISLFSYTQPHE